MPSSHPKKSPPQKREQPFIQGRAKERSATRSSAQTGAFKNTERGNKLQILRVPGWQAADNPKMSWLIHGFSTRVGGLTEAYCADTKRGSDLNLAFTPSDTVETVTANRMLFCKAVCGRKAEGFRLITLKQIHSDLIRTVGTSDWLPRIDPMQPGESVLFKGDGLMTGTKGFLLGIQTADCLPVLLADTKNHVVASFHAGWRGTLARIVENGVGRMRLEFGSNPRDLVAAIGPGIGQCCYAVGEDLRDKFESQFSYAAELFREVSDSDPVKEKYPLLFLTARAPGHSNLRPSLHLDLTKANRLQLLAAGLKPAAIYVAGQCTSCQTNRFFSHRREQGFTGRMLSVIGIWP